MMEPKRPLTELQLAQDIRAYTSDATRLEERRQELVERINGILRDEIIPQVNEALPKHYSIDEKKTWISVRGKYIQDFIVPSQFEANLRLLYNGDIIHSSNKERLAGPRERLQPLLKAMEEKYGLAKVDVCGEPMMMG